MSMDVADLMRHDSGMDTTPDPIAQIRTDYDNAIRAAEEQRAIRITQALTTHTQGAIVRSTGYNRETIRRIVKVGKELLAQHTA